MLRKLAVSCFVIISLLIISGFWWSQYEKRRISQYDDFIATAAERYDINPNLIRSVIWRESDYSADAQGAAGERGLMQLTEAAGAEWADYEKLHTYRPTDLFDPRNNILAGSWYLGRALKRWQHFDVPETPALAEYNAGPSNAKRWNQAAHLPKAHLFLEQIDFPTTKDYILDITRKYELYEEQSSPTAPTILCYKLYQNCLKVYAIFQSP